MAVDADVDAAASAATVASVTAVDVVADVAEVAAADVVVLAQGQSLNPKVKR